MSQQPDGGPAFPIEGGDFSGLHPSPGMSLRDWFAGMSMLAHRAIDGNAHSSIVVRESYKDADYMIEHREVVHSLETTILKVGGELFTCRCGSTTFRKRSDKRYLCDGCGMVYEGSSAFESPKP